jgi:hypothetical protein
MVTVLHRLLQVTGRFRAALAAPCRSHHELPVGQLTFAYEYFILVQTAIKHKFFVQ